MKRLVGFFTALALLLALGTSAAYADSGATCTADPAAGPPGTKFGIHCSGFSPNTIVNAYVVEPDGRAVSGGQVVNFISNMGNGNILTDKNGAASFVWSSQNGTEELPGGGTFGHQIGSWIWVVHELGAAQSVVAEAQTRVTIQANPWNGTGASLVASNSDPTTFNFAGSGFMRDEYVNVWVTLPPNCSGRANVEGASADDPFYQGFFDGFNGPNTVKANEVGNLAFTLTFEALACRGTYAISVYAPGSGNGAIAEIQVRGDSITVGRGATISATPSSVDALDPELTILGAGWGSGAAVNCWSTRPDGRNFDVGTANADTSGTFALDILISGGDSSAPYASEEPGLWSLTCRTPNSADTATTTVLVHALTSDP